MNDEPDFEELDARDRKEEQWREARRLMALYDFEHWHKTGELRRLPVLETGRPDDREPIAEGDYRYYRPK